MIEVTDDEFSQMVSDALDHLPKVHMASVKNVAFVYEDEPSPEQREELKLQCHETLFGLYTGVPLTRRQGNLNAYPPDKITIFKKPMERMANSIPELQEQVRHTVWHEVAHYFGLNHEQIHKLEQR